MGHVDRALLCAADPSRPILCLHSCGRCRHLPTTLQCAQRPDQIPRRWSVCCVLAAILCRHMLHVHILCAAGEGGRHPDRVCQLDAEQHPSRCRVPLCGLRIRCGAERRKLLRTQGGAKARSWAGLIPLMEEASPRCGKGPVDYCTRCSCCVSSCCVSSCCVSS